MATIKSYTDLEQSKKLAEILPLESADNVIVSFGDRYGVKTVTMPKETLDVIRTPFADIRETTMCWSLAALLGVLPSRLFDSTPKRKELYLLPDLDKSYCFYRQFAVKTKGKIYLLTEGECLVDACYEMIIRLHELNLL